MRSERLPAIWVLGDRLNEILSHFQRLLIYFKYPLVPVDRPLLPELHLKYGCYRSEVVIRSPRTYQYEDDWNDHISCSAGDGEAPIS